MVTSCRRAPRKGRTKLVPKKGGPAAGTMRRSAARSLRHLREAAERAGGHPDAADDRPKWRATLRRSEWPRKAPAIGPTPIVAAASQKVPTHTRHAKTCSAEAGLLTSPTPRLQLSQQMCRRDMCRRTSVVPSLLALVQTISAALLLALGWRSVLRLDARGARMQCFAHAV